MANILDIFTRVPDYLDIVISGLCQYYSARLKFILEHLE